jgi:hypothetical protein
MRVVSSGVVSAGELAMSEQDVESKGVMNTNNFDSPVDVAAAAALHCSPESANSTEVDVHDASELDHADPTEPGEGPSSLTPGVCVNSSWHLLWE